MLLQFLYDLRHALRQLLARPGFAVAAIATLALGIGANTLVFSLVDAIFLKPLPYRDDVRLLDVNNSYPKMGLLEAGISVPDYLDRRSGVPALADSALYQRMSLNVNQGGALERVEALVATPSLFSTLGVGAALGRVFGDDEAEAGRDKVVVLSYAFWRDRYNADPSALGRTLRLSGAEYKIVGVMPPQFMFPQRSTQLFVPYVFRPEQKLDTERGRESSGMVGRLAPGATAAEVKAQCDAIIHANAERIGAASADGAGFKRFIESSGLSVITHPLRQTLAGDNRSVLLLLQGAVGLVLLIACANIANLMLTRLSSRQKELSVRAALGAGRGRIARQLMTEALLVALLGGAVGCALAYAGAQAVAASGLLPDWVPTGLDLRVLGFTAALSIVAGVCFGLFPALGVLAAPPQATLRDGSRGAGGGRAAKRTRSVLVVVQIGLAVALVAGAGLLVKSFVRVLAQDPGFRSEAVMSAQVSLPDTAYRDGPARAALVRRVLDEFAALPGVTAVGVTTALPLNGDRDGQSYRIAGVSRDGSAPHAQVRNVDGGYFATLGIPLLRGRLFDRSDWDGKRKVVVIDELFEKKQFPNGDALQRQLDLGSATKPDLYDIIGVVGTVKNLDLAETPAEETFYFNFAESPAPFGRFVLRSAVPPASLASAMRAALRTIDAELPLFDVRTLDDRVQSSLAPRRVPLQLIGGFALLALLLAAIGTYAVLSFAVAQRTGEMGVRMAIGANAGDIRKLVLGEGGRLVAVGLGLGLVGAVLAGQLLRSQLYGVGGADPLVLAAVVGVLAFVALLACWLPARRAAKIAPLQALRYE